MRAEYYYSWVSAPNNYIFDCFFFFVVSHRIWRIGLSCYNESNIKYF